MERHHRFLVVLSVGLAGWGILLFFESTYFGAGFYGVPVPSWDLWIAQLSPLDLNIIDTAFVVVYFVALGLTWDGSHRSLRSQRAGSATSVALLVVVLVLAAAFLGYLGLTLIGVLHSAGGFLGL